MDSLIKISNSDGYNINDIDSDDGRRSESSDDEAGVILHGTPKQKRRMYRKSLGHDSSSEDDFEKEMNAELNETMKGLENKFSTQPTTTSTNQSSGTSGTHVTTAPSYAQDYFDSSSDDEMTSGDKAKVEHSIISNEDLFYDPKMDADDQHWVDSHRRRCHPGSTAAAGTPPLNANRKRASEQTTKMSSSDAVLNCPACMALLCRDCQRHSVYQSQYRAMFVSNCTVDKSETLRYPSKQQQQQHKQQNKKKSKKQKKQVKAQKQDGVSDTSGQVTSATALGQATGSGDVAMETASAAAVVMDSSNSEELYNAVKCTECTTTVGVIDHDEIVHFFNVLASH